VNADDLWYFLDGMAEECGGYPVLSSLGTLLVVLMIYAAGR
jgi:hypothetical protein